MTTQHQTLSKALSRGVSYLDITPTMFREATEHYRAIAGTLQSHGLDADIKPYGSFGTGTVVRPSTDEGTGSYYDLDILAECHRDECGWTTPSSLREEVDGILEDDGTYAKMIEGSTHQCVTLAYAETDSRPAFRLDLSSGVHMDLPLGTDVAFAEEAVNLAWIDPDEWKGSNPKGLCKWFNDQNLRFRVYGLEARRKSLFEENPGAYASVEEIPEDMDRSALQRAVQVVKRSRDIYYRRAREDRAPSSCALMVLVTRFAEMLPQSSDVTTIVESFVEGCQAMRDGRFAIPNPAYPEDLAANWGQEKVDRFFNWIDELKLNLQADLSDSAKRDAAIDAILGSGTSDRLVRDKIFDPAPEPVRINRNVKPWRL